MSNLQAMNLENAEAIIASKKTVVLDFGAAWCGPCKRIAPIVEKFAADNAEKVDAAYVDIGVYPALAQKFGVMGVPTVIVFEGGKEKKRFGANLSIQMLETELS